MLWWLRASTRMRSTVRRDAIWRSAPDARPGDIPLGARSASRWTRCCAHINLHCSRGDCMTRGVISADSHVQEPLTLYSERIPQRYRDRAPRIETRADGTFLMVDGKKPRRLDIAASRLTDEDKEREFRSDKAGGRDIEQRIADQERDGISAEVLYPNQGLALYNSPDAGYQMAVAKAYNDWAIELFGPHRQRF